MRRLIIGKINLFAACILILVAISICFTGSIMAKDIGGQITVWAWPGAVESLETTLPSFHAKYPNVNVKIIAITAGDPIVQKFLAASTAGSGAPDVIGIDGVHVQNYIKKGVLLDITDRMKPLKDKFVAYKMAEIADDAGRMYAVPWDVGPVGLYYRQDIFKQCGLNVPETWNDYIAVGKKFRAKGNYAITSLITTGDTYWIEALFRQLENSVFNRAGDVTLDREKTKKTLTLLKNMFDSGITYNPGATSYVNGWTPAFWSAMRDGRIVTYVGAAWMVNVYKSYIKAGDGGYGEWRIAPLPSFGSNGVRTSNLGGSNLGISPLSKNVDAAWAFIEHAVATVEGQRVQAAYGTFPAYLPALKDPQVLNHTEPLFGPQKINKLFADLQASVPVAYYRPPAYLEGILAATETMGDVMIEKEPVDQAISKLIERLNNIAKQYK